MFWHIDTDIISIIVLAAIFIFSRHLFKTLPEEAAIPRNRLFLRCLHVGIVITFVDIVASVVMETPVSRFMYHLWMTLYFVLLEFVIVQYFLYVVTLLFRENERGYKVVPRVVLISYFAYALFAVSNPWTGFFYTLGPNGEYSRGQFFALMLVLFAFYTIALLILILVRWKHIPNQYPAGVLLLTPFIIALGIAVQLMNPGWLMILPSFMICMVLSFLFLQLRRTRNDQNMLESLSKAAVTDKLTGLLNRTGMEQETYRIWTESAGKGCLVVIADIDDLKGINDRLGHNEGDRIIQAAANEIQRLSEGENLPIRYGGDEFLTLIMGDFDEEKICAYLRRIVGQVGKLRTGKANDTPVCCSVGAAFGVVGRDGFELLCNRADSALYHVKRNGKNGYAFFWPEMERLQIGTEKE